MEFDDDADVLKLYVTQAPPGDGDLNLRMSPFIADEVRSLLDEKGLAHSRAGQFSSGAQLALEAVQVLEGLKDVGGSAALAWVITTFLTRHKGKKVVLSEDGRVREVSDYSASEVMEIVRAAGQRQAVIEATWTADRGGDGSAQGAAENTGTADRP